ASLAERFHPRAAGRINIVVGQCRKRRVREMHKRRGKAAMALIEEWPGQRFLEAHAALPKNETSLATHSVHSRESGTPGASVRSSGSRQRGPRDASVAGCPSRGRTDLGGCAEVHKGPSQLPSKTGFCLAAKARNARAKSCVSMHNACAT